jgi:hypothetical protein
VITHPSISWEFPLGAFGGAEGPAISAATIDVLD